MLFLLFFNSVDGAKIKMSPTLKELEDELKAQKECTDEHDIYGYILGEVTDITKLNISSDTGGTHSEGLEVIEVYDIDGDTDEDEDVNERFPVFR